MNTAVSPIDRLRQLGGILRLDGDKVWYRIPATPEAKAIIAELKRDKDAVTAYLRDVESKPPCVEEVKTGLPRGIRLISYQPRPAPVLALVLSNQSRPLVKNSKRDFAISF